VGSVIWPQEPSVFRQLTVEENLLAVLKPLAAHGATATRPAEELLAQMKLETVRYNGAYTFRAGERRRLEIARSLVLEPALSSWTNRFPDRPVNRL